MVDGPRPPPTREQKRKYDKIREVGLGLHPDASTDKGGDRPMFPQNVRWCFRSKRTRSKKTGRYVNPHRTDGC